ncbi:MAG: hypothetical protein PHW95_03420 [Patescibacteria group bacterium]|nr:hypothetical protein [Patescibacteria group bacterium]
MINYQKKPNGYIALTSLLIIATAALTIGLAVSLNSIDSIQSSYGHSQSARAEAAANAGIEEGLQKLRKNWSSYSGSLSINDDSCTINIVTSGSTASIEAVGKADEYFQKILIHVDSQLSILNWQEE